MSITTTIDSFTTSPSRQNPSTFSEDMDTRLAEENSRITQMNSVGTEMNATAASVNADKTASASSALSASQSASESASSALQAKGSANFKGDYSGATAYTVGQSVYYNNSFYVCKVATTGNLPTDSNYWIINAPLGSVGNINNTLLNLNMASAKALQASYTGEFKYLCESGSTETDRYGNLIYNNYYSGTATSGSLFNLVDTGLSLTVGELKEYVVQVITSGVTEYRWVVGNTATSISFDKPVTVSVDATTTYKISKPRFEADELLVEGTSTNLLTASNDMNNATYNWLDRSFAFTITANSTDILSPDGTNNSAKYVSAGAPATLIARKSGLTLADATVYTSSIWIYVPTQAGVSTWQISNDYNDADIVYAPVMTTFDEWVRIETTKTLTAGRSALDFTILLDSTTPSIGDTFYIFESQLEQLPFASSNIPTTTATVTRVDQDIEISQRDNLPSLSDSVTILLDFKLFNLSSGQRLFNVIGVGGSLSTNLIQVTSGQIRGKWGSVYSGLTTISANTKYRVALRFNASTNILSMFLNGIEFSSVDAGTLTVSDLTKNIVLGRVGSFEKAYGYIGNLRIIPKALTSTEIGVA